MLIRLAPLVVAVLVVLAPFAAEAQPLPSTQGPYGFKDLTPESQQMETDMFEQRLQADWQRYHTGVNALSGPDPTTAQGDAQAAAEYWKRHPNDRPELWRFNSKDLYAQ